MMCTMCLVFTPYVMNCYSQLVGQNVSKNYYFLGSERFKTETKRSSDEEQLNVEANWSESVLLTN